MDKNKIEQEKSGTMQEGVKNDTTLRLTADLEGNYLLDERTSEMKWLGIFYSPAGGSVHRVAKMLKKKIGADKVDMFCVNDIQVGKLLDYKNLILVCSSLGSCRCGGSRDLPEEFRGWNGVHGGVGNRTWRNTCGENFDGWVCVRGFHCRD